MGDNVEWEDRERVAQGEKIKIYFYYKRAGGGETGEGSEWSSCGNN